MAGDLVEPRMNFFTRLLWLAVVVIAVILATRFSHCSIHNGSLNWSIVGSGPVRTERRTLGGPVRTIEASGIVRVRVVTAQTASITMRGSSDLLPLIETELRGNNLRIGLRGGTWIASTEESVVTIATPGVSELHLSGTCQADVEHLTGDQCVIDLSGASNATVGGCAEHVLVTCSGTSDVQLTELSAKTWSVNCTGASSCLLGGTARSAELKTSGTSSILADHMRLDHARATATGASDITLGHARDVQQTSTGTSRITIADGEAEEP